MIMNPALKEFWEQQSRYKVLYGGRASSKSHDAALQSIKLTRICNIQVLCVRQYQNSISQSVFTLVKDKIYSLELQDEYEFTLSEIRHKVTGSKYRFLGIARNIDEIKSTEGIDICWLEEAHALTNEQWDVINPTIRKESSEIWLIFNPANRTDFVWQRFVEHPHKDTVTRMINYDENPFLPETMKRVIDEAKEEDYDEYEHIYLGKVREGDDKALFTYAEIEEAMNNNLEGVDKTGVFSYAVDVARYGSDSSVLSKRTGYQIYGMKQFAKYSTMELANVVSMEYSEEENDKPKAIFVDTIGVGAGVYDRLEEKGHRCIEANVSMRADKTDLYYNKRAEMYFNLRDFVRRGGKLPKDDELKEELLVIRYEFSNANGKIMIQSKDEIRDLLGRSPDKGDSVALHFFSEVRIDRANVGDIQKKMYAQKSRNSRRFRR